MTYQRSDFRRVAFVAFGFSWALLAYPWLSGGVTIPYDAKALFQAQLQFLANALHSGQSPFWNPYTFVGFPQISDPQSLIFSPALLIAYLVETPSYGFLDSYVMALVGAGGFAILMLCLDRRWHPGAGVVAAIAFSFGGSAAWRIQHIGHIQSYAFFAIALWAFLRALERRSTVWGLAAGVASGAMLIEPGQMALLGAYALLIVFLERMLTAECIGDEIASTWRPVLAATAGCIAIAAVPIGLTYLFLQQSNRPVIEFAEAARGSLHPASLLTFVIADLFGALDPGVEYWGPYSAHWDKNELTLSQNMCQIYSGILPALLILTVGLVRGHLLDKGVRVYTLIAALSIIYAVGAYSPGFLAIYNWLPGVRAFRRPVDATFLFGAMVSVLSGYLVHLWLTNSIRIVSDKRKILEFVVMGVAIAAALAVAIASDKSDVAWRPVLFATSWAVASALLLIPMRWIRKGAAATVVLPGLFLCIDLSVNNAANASTGVSVQEVADVLQPQSKNETISFLKASVRRGTGTPWRDRVELLGLGFDWQNCGAVHRLENTLGYNPFRIGLVSRALGARDYNVGVDQRTFSPLFPSYRSVLADMLGMRFVASSAPIESVDPALRPGDLRLIRRTSDAYVYENPRVLPRVLLVAEAMAADFETILADGRWPAFNPRKTALLPRGETSLLTQFPAGSGRDPIKYDGQDASIERYDHTLVEIRTAATEPRLLIVNDTWHPWWFANVDGQSLPVAQANALFRAIPVPAGVHTVRLEFRPFKGAWRQLKERLWSH